MTATLRCSGEPARSPSVAQDHASLVRLNGARQVRAVDDVSFDVAEGECLAIVGESGSGKSTIANMILGIYPQTLGEIAFRGSALPARRDLAHRRAIQLVQQNPLSSLNPEAQHRRIARLALDVHGIGEQIRPRRAHRAAARRGRPARANSARARRRRCPAASASASRSPARWPASRSWSCSTSRPRRSTCWCRRAC